MPDDWRHWASCVGADPELFFTPDDDGTVDDGNGVKRRLKLAVKVYCHACPVMPECHAYAELHHLTGVWGGRYWLDKSLNQLARERARHPAVA